MKEKKIFLSSLIGPAFYEVHRDIAANKHVHYWLKGGRGSGKSSFVSLEIILGMMADPKAHAVVLRKVAVNLKDSVFEQLWWAIRSLGVEDQWERRCDLFFRKQSGGIFTEKTGASLAGNKRGKRRGSGTDCTQLGSAAVYSFAEQWRGNH